jgi:hypothetical protein
MTAQSDHLPAPRRIFIKSVAKADESAPSMLMRTTTPARRSGINARLSAAFNCLGGRAAGVEINLEEFREGLRSQIDEEVASWFNLVRLEMLSEFGQEAMMRTVLEQILRRDDEQRVGRQGAVT